LVTPVVVRTRYVSVQENLDLENSIPMFGILDLQFTPEPEALLLGASVIAGLVVLGYSKHG